MDTVYAVVVRESHTDSDDNKTRLICWYDDENTASKFAVQLQDLIARYDAIFPGYADKARQSDEIVNEKLAALRAWRKQLQIEIRDAGDSAFYGDADLIDLAYYVASLPRGTWRPA